MPLDLAQMFDPRDEANSGLIGSRPWNCHVFELAYTHPDGRSGPFDKVIAKLKAGFSVLVYLPGNCMEAAAECVQRRMADQSWKTCGEHPGGTGEPLTAWNAAGSIVGEIVNWFKRPQGGAPHAIFHNLDVLMDGHGGLLSADVAYSAVFSLVEATRRGVVLGLADREAGQLPAAMQNAFSDQVWLRTIESDAFPRLIPQRLGTKLSADGETLPEGPLQQITARLRWSDPLRAVRIMDMVSGFKNAGELTAILEEIRRLTRPPDFVDPAEFQAADSESLTGFDRERTLTPLLQQIVQQLPPELRRGTQGKLNIQLLVGSGVLQVRHDYRATVNGREAVALERQLQPVLERTLARAVNPLLATTVSQALKQRAEQTLRERHRMQQQERLRTRVTQNLNHQTVGFIRTVSAR